MYVPGNTVISGCGNVGHERMEELTEKYVAPVIGAPGQAAQYSPAACGGGFAKYEKDFEQVNLAVAYPTLPFDHELSAVQNVVSFCFGTGMSSRLFQVLREQKGLVYNVYTACSAYKNNGLFGIYVNTSGKNLAAAADAVRDETEKLREGGLTEEELTRAKIQLKSSMLFSLEDMLSTMNAYGKYALYTRGLYDTDARLKMIESSRVSKLRSSAANISFPDASRSHTSAKATALPEQTCTVSFRNNVLLVSAGLYGPAILF